VRIPPEKIDEVRAAADLVDVVGEYVKLKRRGANYFGLSPFKKEKTPSFSVHPERQFFKCFSTGESGDVFTFLQHVEGLGFIESVRYLADRFGVSLPAEEGTTDDRASDQEGAYAALKVAARFFYDTLTASDEGQPGLDYLLQRGVTKASIKGFGLGFAPARWDGLLTYAQRQHVAPETLERAGLVIPRKGGDGHYDRYRGRVVFPIFSHIGKIVGFGGRVVDPEDEPKYINSPETLVYQKSKVLYGLYQGRQEIRTTGEALLVEGYTDVIALHQAGVENAVATCGTALTPEQVKLLGRYAKRIILLYDGDAAGSNAAVRGVDTILEHWGMDESDLGQMLGDGFVVYAVMLPAGADPDSYVQEHGAEAFREYIAKHRQDFVQFQHTLAVRSGALGTPEGTVQVQERVLEQIAMLQSGLLREQYVRRTAEVFGVPDIHLYRALEEQMSRRNRRKQREAERPPRFDEEPPPAETRPALRPIQVLPEEANLLRLMLSEGPSMVAFVLGHMALHEFSEGPVRAMVSHLLALYESGVVRADPFLGGEYGAEQQRLAADVLAIRDEPSANWKRLKGVGVPRFNQASRNSAADSMTLLKLDRIDEALEAHRNVVYAAEQGDGDLAGALGHLKALQELRRDVKARRFLRAEGDEV
jgi:DNA primase